MCEQHKENQEEDSRGDEGHIQEIQVGAMEVDVEGKNQDEEKIRNHRYSFRGRWVDRVYMKKDHQSENSSGLEYADSIRKRVDIHFSDKQNSWTADTLKHTGVEMENLGIRNYKIFQL